VTRTLCSSGFGYRIIVILSGWLSWLSGVSDNALYPILFLDCLLAFLKPLSNQDDDAALGYVIHRLCFHSDPN
jgi:hypothetical protein